MGNNFLHVNPYIEIATTISNIAVFGNAICWRIRAFHLLYNQGRISDTIHVYVTAHEKTNHSMQIFKNFISPYEDSLLLAGPADPFVFQSGYPLPSFKRSCGSSH